MTITNNLSWNLHINETIKKASKRCCIRSRCDYAVPVFYSFLPNYLTNDLQRVQKRALSIISFHLSYSESLTFLDMDSLVDHQSFFMQFTFLLKSCKCILGCISYSIFLVSHSKIFFPLVYTVIVRNLASRLSEAPVPRRACSQATKFSHRLPCTYMLIKYLFI